MQVSTDNGVILQCTKQTPLLIDPSTRASAWFVQHETARSASVEVTTMHNPRFAHTLELAVRFGKVRPSCPGTAHVWQTAPEQCATI